MSLQLDNGWPVVFQFNFTQGVRMQCVLKTECFAGVGCGNLFPLASVGYGKVAFPRGKSVFAQAGKSVLPVQEPIPVGKRGVREGLSRTGGLFLHGEACFPYGNPFPLASVGYGKVAFPYGNPVSAQAWCLGRSPRLGF